MFKKFKSQLSAKLSSSCHRQQNVPPFFSKSSTGRKTFPRSNMAREKMDDYCLRVKMKQIRCNCAKYYYLSSSRFARVPSARCQARIFLLLLPLSEKIRIKEASRFRLPTGKSDESSPIGSIWFFQLQQ